jgi:hypothetical protein
MCGRGADRHAQPNLQNVDAWKIVERDYDRMRAHEPRERTRDVCSSLDFSQGNQATQISSTSNHNPTI